MKVKEFSKDVTVDVKFNTAVNDLFLGISLKYSFSFVFDATILTLLSLLNLFNASFNDKGLEL